MTRRKETIRNVLIFIIILFVITLLGLLGGFVSGMLGLGITAVIFFIYSVLGLLIVLSVKFFYQYFTKFMMHEITEEEIRKAEQKDEKLLLFKPTTGSIILFLLVILGGISGFFNPPLSNYGTNVDVFCWFMINFIVIGFGLLFWYLLPVFTFTEDSVQIKSHLFYLLGIDRKTVINYKDIISVGPNMQTDYQGEMMRPEHCPWITTNGTTQGYSLICFDDEIIAKLWLRFREKLGDKVTMP